jgi:hypothetical protein
MRDTVAVEVEPEKLTGVIDLHRTADARRERVSADV